MRHGFECLWEEVNVDVVRDEVKKGGHARGGECKRVARLLCKGGAGKELIR